MKYSVIIEGWDPTSETSAITRAELLQEVHDAQPAADIGFRIWSATAPDITTYPVLARFQWCELDGSGNRTNNRYYHDGASWVLERPSAGTIDGDTFADGSISISKLDATGSALQLIRVNSSTPAAFEYIDATAIFATWVTAANKIFTDAPANIGLVGGDKVLVYDISTPSTVTATITEVGAAFVSGAGIANAFNVYAGDKIPFYDGSALKTMTPSYFFEKGITQAPEVTITANNDKIPIADASAAVGSQAKFVQLANLLPDVVSAGVYANPTSVTVNSKGQVTAIGAGSVGIKQTFIINDVALPTVDGATSGTAITITPAFPGPATDIQALLECKTADVDYSVGDVIPIRSAVTSTNAAQVYCFDFNIALPNSLKLSRKACGGIPSIPRKDGASLSAYTPGSWKARIIATYSA